MINKELELYLHIPFCKSKCRYCDFLSAPESENGKKHYVEMLQKEIKEKAPNYKDYVITTIFIGGGTPSSLEDGQISSILASVFESYQVEKDAEITIEANPGTLTPSKLVEYKNAGVNRLSIGLQSANNEELALLGRIHSYEEFKDNFVLARKCGFENINVDLMSALPGQTLSTWEQTLERIIQLNPEHISAYSLIIEEDTPFYTDYLDDCERRDRGEVPQLLPSEEVEREMYYLTQKLLMQSGYQRYEISNYAKEGKVCRHNVGYWTVKNYLGLGLGASSYIEGMRFSNTRELKTYLYAGFKSEDERALSQKECMEEFMFLGLRMQEGISAKEFLARFGVTLETIYGRIVSELEDQSLLCSTECGYKLTERGVDVSNFVLAQFLLDE